VRATSRRDRTPPRSQTVGRPDLSGVEFIDSSGLHVLEQARSQLTADGGSLVLRNPSEAAHRLLTVTEAEDLLQVDADEHADEHPS
jgi:anti-anti-sigma factor